MIQYLILLTLSLIYDYRWVNLVYGFVNWVFFPNKISWFIFVKSICMFYQGLTTFILCELLTQILAYYDVIMDALLLVFPNLNKTSFFDKYFKIILSFEKVSFIITKMIELDTAIRNIIDKYTSYRKIIKYVSDYLFPVKDKVNDWDNLSKTDIFTQSELETTQKLEEKIMESLVKEIHNDKNVDMGEQFEKQLVDLLMKEMKITKGMSNNIPNRTMRRKADKKKGK